MIAASRSACWSTLACRSATSTLPASSQATTTTRMPAMTALAALVPCAELGIRQTSRCVLAAGAVVAADGQQPGELALRAGVGLHADRGVPGDLGQAVAQLVDQPARSRGPARPGANGCRFGELRPGDRGHLGGGVELHRAGAQRDHRAVQREVLVRQRAQVAQHRGLGAVRGEDRVGQVRRPAAELAGQRVRRRRRRSPRRLDAERRGDRPQGRHASSSRRRRRATVSASTRRRLIRRSAAAATTSAARPGHGDGDGVEEVLVHERPGRRRAASRPGRRRCGARGRRSRPGPRARGRRRRRRP